jgi:hypothetical protein
MIDKDLVAVDGDGQRYSFKEFLEFYEIRDNSGNWIPAGVKLN